VDHLEEKVDKILEKVSTIETTLAVQGSVLEEHQRRSLANEENVSLLREDFKPIQRHVTLVEGGFKLLGIVSTIAGIATAIAKFLHFV
jgi:hypothetical protein